ncbi:proline dehydrogenase family protein [Leifsonia shinshuensis]|uniref:L-glutamate gamma-semialdehyde dehydrogenase n=1 Tax=Leifsonia shinshuensis TaxID=150026 RepID=A0A853CTC5_9MICO|nr:bifunctional proline dehydrogenase/L-glutamate gamma-semialdehyde dehydrogenase [Leifsonia shinshuensis]NYJ21865.1 RHH-type proline utilization regulon transcriptional repressor/proline dehydrogenase/delta 1-pyrroline-5-carboxylate dehydrogenase [Leifsonia shinshuensis]
MVEHTDDAHTVRPDALGAPAAGEARPAHVAQEAVELVRRWLAESARSGEDAPRDPAAERLAGVLRDPHGLDFAVGFIDGVARPQDLFVAGYNLQRVAKRIPAFLPWYMRAAIWLGGVFGPVLPWVVIPIARRVLRSMVGHLVVDATPEKLGPAIAQLRSPKDREGHGARLNLNLLGEAVLGEQEAARRLEGTRALLARDDVDYVSIKVSSIASQLSMWSFDETVDRVVERLVPLYELAAASPTPKFINLDMEEYRDLDLTIAVFERILGRPGLLGLEAGIVLQAYLPDALDALQGLTEWATRRRAQGGAPIKVRVVKGANLAMERVDAAIHGWPLATYGSKQATDTNYKRVLDWALTPEHTDAVKIGVAGHNLFDVAYAWILASHRGVTGRIDFEMLLGMATEQAEAVKRTVGQLLLYTPVVDPGEFDVAISYLIRRLEENASQENFMSAVFELGSDRGLFDRERDRFLASVADLEADPLPRGAAPLPNRTQDRSREWEQETAESFTRPPAVDAEATVDGPAGPAGAEAEGLTSVVLGLTRGSGGAALEPPAPAVAGAATAGFQNTADTDPSLAANRGWGRRILARSATSELGLRTIAAAEVVDPGHLDRILTAVRSAGTAWGARPGSERGAVLDRAGHALEANRDRLIEVMAGETGKTIAEADVEVSEAVDFAHYYASLARELDAVQGAVFVPSALTVVTPPWNFPVAIPAGGVLAALAAGSGVVIKPAPQARRAAAVMVEALWEAGIPQELLALVDVAENDLGRQLVADPRVDRVILTGSYETAKLFRSWRPDLPLLAETSGKNAIIVTPSADYDLAVADIVKSAFGHAGQKCSAASLVILVGSAARSERFRNQLVDATTSLRVGYPQDPVSQMGPLIEPASGKLLHALTTLGADEEWLVEPRPLDDTGRLWSPGIRTGVQPGSYFHLTEFFGPVLGIMTARNLDEAIRFQNAIEYGLTAGLHSLDSDELAQWLDTVEAGNLYVNRGITGAIVRRQPFGGWKRSSVGAGTKAGGPNYLLGLGSWQPESGASSSSLHLRGLEPRVSDLIESGQSSMDYPAFDLVRRSALSDAIAVATEYHQAKDVSGLGVERNIFRYRPVPVAIRLSEGSGLPELLRVMAAATVARSPFTVSTSVALPRGTQQLLKSREVEVVVETDEHWLSRVRGRRVTAHRIRLIGGDPAALAAALGGTPDVAIYSGPVTPSGRIEVLPFLHEQAISITNHRFGNPTTFSEGVI